MQIKDLQLKRALRTALLVLLLNAAGMTKGYAETIGDLCYSLNRTTLTATVTGHVNGQNATGSLVIPSTVTYTDYVYINGQYVPITRTYTVTEIGSHAFSGCNGLTGFLIIPNSVTKIDIHAFYNCSGFTGSLTIPNSVTTIEQAAFSGCSGFTGSLTIGNSVTKIGKIAFRDCSGFNGNLTIGNSVTTIGGEAFWNCSGFTGSLVIPNSVTEIGGTAFKNCSGFNGNLTIGNSVTTIGGEAFWNCSGFNGNLTIGNSVTTIGGEAFWNCSGFTGSLVIPNSVTEIDWYAFSGCSGFTGSLTIGNSVTTIGDGAFSGCSGFTGSLVIPNSVTTIGYEAFIECSGFTGTLTIGESLHSLDGLTHANSIFHLFSHIIVASGNTQFDSRNNCDAVIETSTNTLLFGCNNTTIPNSVTAIGNMAFQDCTGLTLLTIPNSITTIGNYAFENCTGLSSLTIGNSVTSIGNRAFRNCSGLTEVYYNAANAIFNSNWDWDCIFEDCNGILLFVIGEDVESLPNLFDDAPLQFIKSKAVVPPTVGGSTFGWISIDIPVIVPCGALEAYQSAPYWSEFTNIREGEYGLAVKANPNYLGTAIIVQEPDCNSPHASVRAIPVSGCQFINWTCNGEMVSQNQNYSFNMEEDMVLTANFAAQKRFVGTVSQFWLDPENWEPVGVPAETMSVDVQSNVVIDTDVIVGSVILHDN